MPTRLIRDGILSSARINALSPGAELLYRRLLSVVDDYGCFYAAPATVRGACWPTCPDKATERQIAGWLKECASGERPLIVCYQVDGCSYLQVSEFGQQVRTKSKFPQPENNLLADCQQIAHARRSRSRNAESEAESRGEAHAPISQKVTSNSAPIPPTHAEVPKDTETRIRKLADAQPDPQEFETGVRCAVQAVLSSGNPTATLAAMEATLPLWWEAMRDGRARVKPLRYVILDSDYTRRPREPSAARKMAVVDPIAERRKARTEALMRD